MTEPKAYLYVCRKKPSLKALSENKREVDLLYKGFVPMPLYSTEQLQSMCSQQLPVDERIQELEQAAHLALEALEDAHYKIEHLQDIDKRKIAMNALQDALKKSK